MQILKRDACNLCRIGFRIFVLVVAVVGMGVELPNYVTTQSPYQTTINVALITPLVLVVASWRRRGTTVVQAGQRAQKPDKFKSDETDMKMDVDL